MNCRKALRQVMSLILVVPVLSACSVLQATPVSQGQVRGVLTDKEGQPLPDRVVDVFLATILDEKSGEIQLNNSWQSTLDDSGAFLIEDVPPGKYCLVLFLQQRAAFGVVLNEDKLFTFEVPQDSGIDLGRVDASQIRLL